MPDQLRRLCRVVDEAAGAGDQRLVFDAGFVAVMMVGGAHVHKDEFRKAGNDGGDGAAAHAPRINSTPGWH